MKLSNVLKKNRFSGGKSRFFQDKKIISEYFDATYYMNKYSDLDGKSIDPVLHYCEYGWRERRNPCSFFNTEYYLRSHPDIEETGINPFVHYIKFGRALGWAGRLYPPVESDDRTCQIEVIRRNMDQIFYSLKYHNLLANSNDNATHYFEEGWINDFNPSIAFSTKYYLHHNPDIAEMAVNPFYHWITEGRAQGRAGRRPNSISEDRLLYEAGVVRRYMDVDWYISTNEDLSNAVIDPAEHYCQFGWLEGRDPSPEFSTVFYLSTNDDVFNAELNPYWHYLVEGKKEGRSAKSLEVNSPSLQTNDSIYAAPHNLIQDINEITKEFDEIFYLNSYVDVANAGIDPLTHYWYNGWREGRDPNSNFSTDFYLESYSDVREYNINPFWHYVKIGRAEGRICQSPIDDKIRHLKKLLPFEEEVKSWVVADVDNITLLSAAEIIAMAGFKRPIAMTFTHDDYISVPGGVQLCVQKEQLLFNDAEINYLVAYPTQPLPRLKHEADDFSPFVSLVLNGLYIGRCSYQDLLKAAEAFNENNVSIQIIIHHLLGHYVSWLIKIIETVNNAECLVWIHDFITVCPSYTLLRNGLNFCDAPPVESNECYLCRYGHERVQHLKDISDLFARSTVLPVFPSEFIRDKWRSHINFKTNDGYLVPHMELLSLEVEPFNDGEKQEIVKIGFVGTPVRHKGWDVFLKFRMLKLNDPRYKFYYFGSHNIVVTGIESVFVKVSARDPYAMIDAIKEADCDLIIHWATWPETFSFSTFESIAGGAYVITNEISGNVAATINRTQKGLVFRDETELLANENEELLLKLRDKRRSEKDRFEIQVVPSRLSLEIAALGSQR